MMPREDKVELFVGLFVLNHISDPMTFHVSLFFSVQADKF